MVRDARRRLSGTRFNMKVALIGGSPSGIPRRQKSGMAVTGCRATKFRGWHRKMDYRSMPPFPFCRAIITRFRSIALGGFAAFLPGLLLAAFGGSEMEASRVASTTVAS